MIYDDDMCCLLFENTTARRVCVWHVNMNPSGNGRDAHLLIGVDQHDAPRMSEAPPSTASVENVELEVVADSDTVPIPYQRSSAAHSYFCSSKSKVRTIPQTRFFSCNTSKARAARRFANIMFTQHCGISWRPNAKLFDLISNIQYRKKY